MAVLTLAMLVAAGTGAAYASTNHAVYIDDRKVELSGGLWLSDGTTYAPVKELAELMGWQVAYDTDSSLISVSNSLGDKLSFRTGESEVIFNGKTYDIPVAAKQREDNAYFPLRILAEAMHATVGWQAEAKTSVVQAAKPYVVESGDTLAAIAKEHDTTATALKKRNGLPGDALEAGQPLKVVVPEFLDPASSDLALLAKIVQVEAGDEPYEGKLAIANVVLNRVRSGTFPDTVRGVIFAPGQFPPALHGDLKTETANSGSIQAARAALAGENNVPGAYYFFNPKLEPGKAKKVKIVKKIGHHIFAA